MAEEKNMKKNKYDFKAPILSGKFKLSDNKQNLYQKKFMEGRE